MQRRKTTRRRPYGEGELKRRTLAAILAVAGAGAVLAAILIGGTFCPVDGLLGVPCPFCGLTRATVAMLDGDLPLAFDMHPLLFLVLADILVALDCVRRGAVPKTNAVFLAVSAALLAGLYVYRMVTLYPNVAPMTYNHRSLLGRLLKY